MYQQGCPSYKSLKVTLRRVFPRLGVEWPSKLDMVVCYRKDNPAGTQFLPSPVNIAIEESPGGKLPSLL